MRLEVLSGLSLCPGGDCHGIDHAWCAPPRHSWPYSRTWERVIRRVDYRPRHRKAGPVLALTSN